LPDPALRCRVVALYLPHDPIARDAVGTMVDAIVADHPLALVLGDFNATTRAEDVYRPQARRATSVAPWSWLVAHETSGALVDTQPAHLHTRNRLYSGTTSYIDRIYVTDAWHGHGIGVCSDVCDVGGRPGASDHDPVCMRSVRVV
jgi:endonuclease/exonuclease/phosphatase family metal-dependent hydrolase